jgi:hypothetical protein
VEPVAAERDVGKPEVLHGTTLTKRLLHFEIVLPGGRMLKSLDKDAHRAPRLVDGSLHRVVMPVNIKYLRFHSPMDVFAGQGMIRSCVTGGACKQRAGKNGGKKVLHCLWFVFRNESALTIPLAPAVPE